MALDKQCTADFVCFGKIIVDLVFGKINLENEKKQETILIKNTMIMKTLSTTILFCLLGINLLSAQAWSDRSGSQYDNDWSLGFGFNGIDDSGKGAKDLFNVSDNWNFAFPFYLTIENHINNQFSVGATLSFNEIKEGKVIDRETILKGGNEAGYFAFDLAGKYSFRDLLNLRAFEPYVFVGFGVIQIGDYQTEENNELREAKSRMTFNSGLGANYWFSSTWGINLNLAGKFGVGSDVSNQLQSSLGVLYHLTY
jgi:hypothetical protein